MNKSDFVAIQSAIGDMRRALGATGMPPKLNHIIDSAAKTIADTLAKQNPKFKRTEFLKGCGVTS